MRIETVGSLRIGGIPQEDIKAERVLGKTDPQDVVLLQAVKAVDPSESSDLQQESSQNYHQDHQETMQTRIAYRDGVNTLELTKGNNVPIIEVSTKTERVSQQILAAYEASQQNGIKDNAAPISSKTIRIG